MSALHEVGLDHRLGAWPPTLSGGEAQLLLLDEPFAALDALTRIRMHELISRLWSVHRPSVLLVTHDVDEARLLADRALVPGGGRINSEQTITEPHPRDPAMTGFSATRATLLKELGVHTEGASADRRKESSP